MTKTNKLLEKPISFYIQGIQDKTIKVNNLPIEAIEQIVEALYIEGSSTSQIAQFLGKSDRTIRRYLQGIRKKNALEPNAGLAKQVIGELLQKAMASHAYLLRLARSKEASITEKTQAEYASWRVLKDLFEKLQSVGYLPLKQQALAASSYEVIPDKSLGELKNEVIELEQEISESVDANPNFKEELKSIKTEIEKAELVYKVTKLSDEQSKSKQDKEEQNEQ